MAKKITNNGKKGGLLKGKSHPEGGIPAVVAGTGKPVELEGGEAIINKQATKQNWKLLSKINQSAGGGVPIANPETTDDVPEHFAKGGNVGGLTVTISDLREPGKMVDAKIGDTVRISRRKTFLAQITNITEKWVIFLDLDDNNKRKDLPYAKFMDNAYFVDEGDPQSISKPAPAKPREPKLTTNPSPLATGTPSFPIPKPKQWKKSELVKKKFQVANKEEARQLQEFLFTVGFEWKNGKRINFDDKPDTLYFVTSYPGKAQKSINAFKTKSDFDNMNANYEEITLEQLGLKQPKVSITITNPNYKPEFKVGDKVKIPTTRSVGLGYPLRNSAEIIKARSVKQDYLWVVGITTSDSIYLSYEKDPSLRQGDIFSKKDDVELYDQPTSTTAKQQKTIFGLSPGAKVKIPLTKSVGSPIEKSGAIDIARKEGKQYLIVERVNKEGRVSLNTETLMSQNVGGDDFDADLDNIELYEEPTVASDMGKPTEEWTKETLKNVKIRVKNKGELKLVVNFLISKGLEVSEGNKQIEKLNDKFIYVNYQGWITTDNSEEFFKNDDTRREVTLEELGLLRGQKQPEPPRQPKPTKQQFNPELNYVELFEKMVSQTYDSYALVTDEMIEQAQRNNFETMTDSKFPLLDRYNAGKQLISFLSTVQGQAMPDQKKMYKKTSDFLTENSEKVFEEIISKSPSLQDLKNEVNEFIDFQKLLPATSLDSLKKTNQTIMHKSQELKSLAMYAPEIFYKLYFFTNGLKQSSFSEDSMTGSALEEFNLWFNGSKVEKDGKPLVVYHGTRFDEFTRFSFTMFPGAYFAENLSYSEWFANVGGKPGTIYKCYLDIKNPMDLLLFKTDKVTYSEFVGYIQLKYGYILPENKMLRSQSDKNGGIWAWAYLRNAPEWLKLIHADGQFDGIAYYENNPSDILKSGEENVTKAWLVFEPQQIKSMYGNMTYSVNSEDIRMKKGGVV